MKRLFYVLCLMTVLVSPAGASHLLGGELYYTHVTGRTYEVTLALYGDCAGAAFLSSATR